MIKPRAVVLLAAAAVAGGSFLSSASAASTHTVCSSGCDYTTMAAAIAASGAGDTIEVHEDLTVTGVTTVNKDVTVTGVGDVTITRTGTSSAVFTIPAAGATISDLTLTTPTAVGGTFITVGGSADGVTLTGNTIYAPQQPGPMSTWITNRAFVNGAVDDLTVTDNVIHSLRTGGFIDGGNGTISGNTTWNTKGDYLLADQADFDIAGNSAGDPALPSEWGIVIFAVNNTPYDVQALGAANSCLSVWDQGTGETYVDADCDGTGDTPPPTSKDDCKNDGYLAFNNPSFRNQGECVSSVASSKA